MNVETYEINEANSAGETDALDHEAVAMIERLGLNGQRTLISKAEGAAGATVLPYQEMTAEELAVYGIIFPQHDDVAMYAAGPIPLRVLQVVALAVERQWFTRLEVWHKRAGSAKEDPILVGCKVDPQHTWMVRQHFLLARWGDALAPYAALLMQAAETARERLASAAHEAAAEIAQAIAVLPRVSDTAAIRWAASSLPSASGTKPREA